MRPALLQVATSMALHVLHVVAMRSPFQVVRSIVLGIAVFVAAFSTFRPWPDKRLQNQLMHRPSLSYSVVHCVDVRITFGSRAFQDSLIRLAPYRAVDSDQVV